MRATIGLLHLVTIAPIALTAVTFAAADDHGGATLHRRFLAKPRPSLKGDNHVGVAAVQKSRHSLLSWPIEWRTLPLEVGVVVRKARVRYYEAVVCVACRRIASGT